MAEPTQPTPSRTGPGRRDLYAVAAAVGVLFIIGLVADAYDRVESTIRGSTFGDEAVAIVLLLLGGVTFLAVRQARASRSEIARREASEARAAAAEQRLRTLVERVPIVAYSWDTAFPPGGAPADYISPQIETLLGVTADAWLEDPQAWASYVHPDDVDRVLAAWNAATTEAAPFSAEYRLRRSDGAWRWVRDDANLIGPGPHGSPVYQGVIVDITERHEAEAAVRAQEQRWRMLLEDLPMVAYEVTYGADGTIVDNWVARGIQPLLGISMEQWNAADDVWQSMIHPDDLDDVSAHWARLLENGVPFDVHYRMVRSDGSLVWVQDRAVKNERDGRGVIQGAFADVTARMQAEAALQLAEAQFRTLVEQLPAIVFAEDPRSGDLTYVSPQIETIYGYTAEEWMNDRTLWRDRLHPDDRAWVVEQDDADTGDAWSVDYRSLTRDGRMLWVHNEARLLRDAAGEPLVWQGVVYDITERKEAEERLRNAEERFRTLIEQLPVAVYTDAVDEVSTALYISPQYETLTGFSPEERLRDPELWVRMLHPDDRDRVLAESEDTNDTGEPFDTEYRIVAADGRIVWLHDHAVQVRDASGTARWHGVLQDVTETHAAAQAIARRDAILEATSFAAERFLRGGSWETDLVEVLRHLAVAGDATRCAVFRNHDLADGALGVSIVASWPPEEEATDAVEARHDFAWEAGGFGRWIEELGVGRPIHGSIDGFPEIERAYLGSEPMPIHSLVAIPIFAENTWWGYISFDHVDEGRSWLEADVEALTLTARTIGAAIDRERATERLDEAQARYRNLIEQIPAVTYIEDVETGREVYSSPQTQLLFGYTPEEWGTRELWIAALHPDDRARVLAADEAADSPEHPFHCEYRIRTAGGDYIWVRDDAAPIPDPGGALRFWQGVRFDITAEKHAEAQLREAEERYRLLVEQTPAITYVDEYVAEAPLWQTRYVSPQVESMLGYTPEEWMADPVRWLEMIHPDDRAMAAEADARHYETGEPVDIEIRVYRRDGELRWVRDQAVVVRDERGAPRFSQGLILDVTERKMAELAMLDAERRYRTLIESIPAVTYIDTLEEPWATVYVSPQVTETFGYPPGEWVRQGLWMERVHPQDRDDARRAVDTHASQGVPFDLEYRFQHRDGRWLWVRDQAFVVRDDDGTPLFSQGVMYDITDAKHAEERLREAEERYRAIVEHIPAAIYLDAPDGDMETVYISPQIRDIMGIEPERWRERPAVWLDVMHPDDRPEIERSYLRAVRAGEPWRGEYRVLTPDGRTVWIHDETTFLHGPDGEAVFLQGVLFDITERKLAEQALRESEQRERDAAERLRALDEMKNTFLAAVSHELRSPLTSILGLALTLERAPDIQGHERDDLLTRLSANARKLDRLLKDLLDIDRLNRGIVEPQYRVSDVAALTRRTVEHLDATGDRTIVVVTDPVVIPIDPPKIERIIENLVMNAVRHTDGDRTIWVEVHSHAGGVEIVVADDGPGVPEEIRTAIFEPFRQGPTASPHSPGTGIGLSLVARFAELHGGRAWVDERDGGGAAFHVEIPGRAPGDAYIELDEQRADAS